MALHNSHITRPAAPGLMTELDDARIHRGLSRTELAAAAGISLRTATQTLTTGKAQLHTVVALADALGMDLHIAPKPPAKQFKGQPLRPCGTLAAAHRHYMHGEPLDALCRATQRLYDRTRKRRYAAARRASNGDQQAGAA